ncbi:hypothetical protein PDPE_1-01343 [Photobacterium damselae subsp. piscicida]|nr:hypothetical protein BEI67_12455 [Photobacterium damselae subsp. piscicida]BBC40503.1 hypothetical protein PDPE_1-01343 [Photobacterium damselae subsp. piscicida]
MQSFTQQSLTYYFESLLQRTRRAEIKNTSYNQYRTKLLTAFRLLDISESWFDNIPSLPKNDTEPFEAYSPSDLKKLLPLLRSLFKQTSKQFLIEPHKHMSAHQSQLTCNGQLNLETVLGTFQ